MNHPSLPGLPTGSGPPGAPAPAARPEQGSGKGTASLIFSILAAAIMHWTAPFSLLAALLTRPSQGPGKQDWVAPFVLWSFPVLFGLLAVTFGIAAVRSYPRRSRGWRSGVAGLWISGAEAAAGLALVLVHGDLMILF